MIPQSNKWFELEHVEEQYPFLYYGVGLTEKETPLRYLIAAAGRRSGKTIIAKRILCFSIFKQVFHKPFPANFVVMAPTASQVKTIWWDDVKNMLHQMMALGIKSISESLLSIEFIDGSKLRLISGEKPERVEGIGIELMVFDEVADIPEKAWSLHGRPCLASEDGCAIFVGCPEGTGNWFYQIYRDALYDKSGRWKAWTWPSSVILPPEIIEIEKSDLDEHSFEQEYNASFLTYTGRVYYPYSPELHVTDKLKYDRKKPLIFAMDFNVSPGTASIIQETILPNKLEGTAILSEVHIGNNSNTEYVCNKLLSDWGKHEGEVHCYGDPAGGARGSAKIIGSDWDIIREILGRHFGPRLKIFVDARHPSIRDRINAVNKRLKNTLSEVHMMLSSSTTKHTQIDFDSVSYIPGTSNEVNKKNQNLTHLTDGIGYYIHRKFSKKNILYTMEH